jgi:hypothetical protein
MLHNPYSDDVDSKMKDVFFWRKRSKFNLAILRKNASKNPAIFAGSCELLIIRNFLLSLSLLVITKVK